MIVVKIYQEQDGIVAVDVCGRANAKRGGDRVESAVCAIMHTLLMGLRHFRRIALEVTEEETQMHVGVRRGHGRKEVQALMRAAEDGLRQQSDRYPNQMRVVERRIYPEGVML